MKHSIIDGLVRSPRGSTGAVGEEAVEAGARALARRAAIHHQDTWNPKEPLSPSRLQEIINRSWFAHTDVARAALEAVLPHLASAPAGAGDGRAPVRDIGIVGPVNGMNEPDLSGSYFRLVLTKGEAREEYRISLGAAEILSGELAGLLDPASPRPDARPEGEPGLRTTGRLSEAYRVEDIEDAISGSRGWQGSSRLPVEAPLAARAVFDLHAPLRREHETLLAQVATLRGERDNFLEQLQAYREGEAYFTQQAVMERENALRSERDEALAANARLARLGRAMETERDEAIRRNILLEEAEDEADSAELARRSALADGEGLARRFHEAYERLAPSFGYETRTETRQFDPTTPNGRLMIAVCSEITAPPSTPAPVERPVKKEGE